MGAHFEPAGYISRGTAVPLINPHEVRIVGVDIPDSDELWFAFCPRAGEQPDADFVQTIREPNEVESPIHVCRNGEHVIVLAGRRRVKASRIVWDEQASKPESERVALRYIMHKGTPEQLYAVNVRENNARKDLTPLQRAIGWRTIAARIGQVKVALLNGVSQATVSNALAIFDCAPKVQAAFDAGQLAAVFAPKLAQLPRTEQVAKLDEMIATDATKGRKAREIISGGKPEVPQRMRPRRVVEALRRELADQPEVARVLDFVLGWDMATDNGALRAAALRALGDVS